MKLRFNTKTYTWEITYPQAGHPTGWGEWSPTDADYALSLIEQRHSFTYYDGD